MLRGSCLCGGVQFEVPETFEPRDVLPLRELQEALGRRRHRERAASRRRGHDPRGRGAAAHLPARGGHREDVLLGLRLEPVRRRLARVRAGERPPQRDRLAAREPAEEAHLGPLRSRAGRRSPTTGSSASTPRASSARPPGGKREPDVGPPSGRFAAWAVPPCASAIVRTIERPSPDPPPARAVVGAGEALERVGRGSPAGSRRPRRGRAARRPRLRPPPTAVPSPPP